MFNIPSQWYICFLIIMFFFIIISRERRTRLIIRKNKRLKKKGIKRTMPLEILNECVGKEVIICVEGELSGFKATVVSVNENWIKAEEKNNIRLINADMITQIYIPKNKK